MKDRAKANRATGLRSRRPWTVDDAREVLRRQQASGLSIGEFSRQVGLVPQRLRWWQKRLVKAGADQVAAAAPAVGASFVPVVVRATPPSAVSTAAPLRVRIGDHVVVDVARADAETAAWVAWLAVACTRGGES